MTQKIAICAPSDNFVAISSQLRHVSTIAKNLLDSNMSSTCPHNMANFGPLMSEICWRVWGTPANLNGFRVLAALLHAHEGKAGMVLFAGKTVSSMPERFVCTLVQKGAIQILFLSFPYSSGRQPNFAAFNSHLYSAGRPPRWALTHILV